MAYRFKSGESIPEAVRRIAQEEIESALGQLTHARGAARDEGIHEARKSVKKLRALLRLMRPELGSAYRAEAANLRKIGRTLSDFRDAGAIIETFDSLREKYQDEIGKQGLLSIRRGLVASKQQAEKRGRIENVLARISGTLTKTVKRVKSWPLSADGFPAIAPGMDEIYRRGRRALKTVRKHPKAENYHDWRKRVKDHWYHVRLIENVWTDVMQAYEGSLKSLETWLGDDHNLVLLREKVLAQPADYGKDAEMAVFVSLVDRYQKELRDNALSMGERVYDDKPREFTRHMKDLWHTWETQPESLTEAAAPKAAAKRKHRHSPASR